MTVPKLARPTADLLEQVARESTRRLSAAEFDAWVNAPWTDRELADLIALVRWFTKRYPTPAARLQAGRAAYRRARELMPASPHRARDDRGE